MAHLSLAKVLDSAPGVKKEAGGYALNEELGAQLFIALGREVMTIARVIRVELSAELIRIETSRGERFFFPPEQLVGLKFGSAETGATRSQAGFR